jgi:hypothetical protein
MNYDPVTTAGREASDPASRHSTIRVATPAQFDRGAAQTEGSLRLAAIAPQLDSQSFSSVSAAQ